MFMLLLPWPTRPTYSAVYHLLLFLRLPRRASHPPLHPSIHLSTHTLLSSSCPLPTAHCPRPILPSNHTRRLRPRPSPDVPSRLFREPGLALPRPSSPRGHGVICPASASHLVSPTCARVISPLPARTRLPCLTRPLPTPSLVDATTPSSLHLPAIGLCVSQDATNTAALARPCTDCCSHYRAPGFPPACCMSLCASFFVHSTPTCNMPAHQPAVFCSPGQLRPSTTANLCP